MVKVQECLQENPTFNSWKIQKRIFSELVPWRVAHKKMVVGRVRQLPCWQPPNQLSDPKNTVHSLQPWSLVCFFQLHKCHVTCLKTALLAFNSTSFQFIIIIMIAKTLQMKLFISNIFMSVKLMPSTKECVIVDFFSPVIRSGSFLSCSRDLIKLAELVLVPPLSWTSTLPQEQLQSRCDVVSTYRTVSLFCLYSSLCLYENHISTVGTSF